LGGFIAAILIIGIGTGGIKSNVSPLIAEQYQRKAMAIKTLPTGERIILSPAATIQRIYMVFYMFINVGSLSLLATPYMERDVGFWSAYLLAIW
jgi:proton-dependent oligopeptide transporter, POT family